MKRVLMIAYHFPPLAGSSGIQRTLRFVRHLPELGWDPIVLSAHPRAYDRTSADQLADVPDDVPVIRAPAWDTAKHLALAGQYPGFLARPDRWASWWLGAVPSGLKAIRRFRPAAIWSTYPIATAHCIGHTLAARSGLPWIADFRDPMAQDDYPSDPATWRAFERIERRSVARARFSTFTTPSALGTYRTRYPEQASGLSLLENGYDEETFAGAASSAEPLNPGKLTLLHSGIVYPSERDPTALFVALARLRGTAPLVYARLRVRFRASVHDELLAGLAAQHEVADAVEILPAVGYREALSEMLRADALLILQAANCNAQIPAKFYEYLRAGRPVLALTDPLGDTAQVTRSAGIEAIAPLDDAEAIAALLASYAEAPGTGTLPTAAAVAGASRRGRSRELADLLERATEDRP
jgi:glycosyltransferase involved in cell wall biosynthesis